MSQKPIQRTVLPLSPAARPCLMAAVLVSMTGAASPVRAYAPEALAPAREPVLSVANEKETVQFALTLPLRNTDQLATLLQDLYTPGSEHYHQFLSPTEFDRRFAPTAAQYDALKQAALQMGLQIRGEQPGRTLLDVSAPSSKVREWFHTQMEWRQTHDGSRYLAPHENADVPFQLLALNSEVVGLNAHPFSGHFSGYRGAWDPHSGHGAGGSYQPADIRNAYNVNGIQNGGQTVALYELSSANYADAATYAKQFGLTNPSISNIDVDGGSSSLAGAVEVMLDIEMVMAISNPSSILVYTGPNSFGGALDTWSKIASDAKVNQVSTSWGLAEQYVGSSGLQAENTIFAKMAAEGIAVFAAAGDSGANDNGSSLSVDDPASQPFVTGVGGTHLSTDSSAAYASEAVWNTSISEGGGGGISGYWSLPSYQKNLHVNAASGQFSTTMRNVPDVALNADPATGYLIYESGSGGWGIVGGTSAAAPLWAGFWGLVGKGFANAGRNPARAGFANPLLYAIGQNATLYGRDFHDVRSGNNGHYSAVAGYDTASGWGSFNAGSLYTDLVGGAVSAPPPPPPPQAPAAPSGLVATGTTQASSGAVSLTWKAVSGAQSYSIYMGTSSKSEGSLPIGSVCGATALIYGLSHSKTYYFQITAASSAGTSPKSAEVSAMTK